MNSLSPDLEHERRIKGIVCGVDEAGRGPLAGPVVAAAVILNPDCIPSGLNDSKVLSAARRRSLYGDIVSAHQVGVAIAEPEEIDRMNILGASLAAMRRAVLALPITPDHALIDGNRQPPDLPCHSETVIKGDAKSLSIAAASILAKVTRDRLMILADERFPGYGFARHKGYPTAFHRSQLNRLGPCPIHRRGFAPVDINLP
ncbi:MAG: ribonuclease HII [Hyphomonadaceae bacterium]|nr:ribonuclease HII [Hyphomonadaceae bacterium]MBC6412095.1 ribonuclease HII [Hyphomonadaceae bacterium]